MSLREPTTTLYITYSNSCPDDTAEVKYVPIRPFESPTITYHAYLVDPAIEPEGRDRSIFADYVGRIDSWRSNKSKLAHVPEMKEDLAGITERAKKIFKVSHPTKEMLDHVRWLGNDSLVGLSTDNVIFPDEPFEMKYNKISPKIDFAKLEEMALATGLLVSPDESPKKKKTTSGMFPPYIIRDGSGNKNIWRNAGFGKYVLVGKKDTYIKVSPVHDKLYAVSLYVDGSKKEVSEGKYFVSATESQVEEYLTYLAQTHVKARFTDPVPQFITNLETLQVYQSFGTNVYTRLVKDKKTIKTTVKLDDKGLMVSEELHRYYIDGRPSEHSRRKRFFRIATSTEIEEYMESLL